MTEVTTPLGRQLDEVIESDPRLSAEYVRLIERPDAPVVLVGVVHDHPASIHRVEAVIDAVSPATLAVELPELLVPAFGTTDDTQDDVGGEMTAAIDAAGSTPVLGIDVPSLGTVRALAAELRDRDVESRTALRTIRETWRITTHAILGRLAHEGVPRLPTVADLEFGQEYDLPADATPAAQAAHEATHLRRSTTLLRTFEPPAATRLMDAVRERHMSERLDAIRADGAVVGVVGYGHLEAIESALQENTERSGQEE